MDSHVERPSDDFVQPAYGERSLSEVLPAVGRALGFGEALKDRAADSAGASWGLPEAPAYVVFLIDGLGAMQLNRYAAAAPYLASLLGPQRVGTAAVPSTTATSLVTLGTSLPPGAHGLVGYTSRIPGTDRLLNALQWDKGVDPIDWQPHPTAFALLSAAGCSVRVVNRRDFAGSGLTVASQRGAEFVGADRVGERIAAAVAAKGATPQLSYLYEGDLDWTGHRYGVASNQWLQQLAAVDAQLEQLREALPATTRLVVIADHGMIDSPAHERVNIDLAPAMRHGVQLLGGEARFRHLYCHAGAVEDVVSTWRELLGDRAAVLTRDEAHVAGWFGAISPGVLPRIGDVVVACRGTTAIVSSVDFPYETTLVGLHGSLTRAEMEIPVLVD